MAALIATRAVPMKFIVAVLAVTPRVVFYVTGTLASNYSSHVTDNVLGSA